MNHETTKSSFLDLDNTLLDFDAGGCVGDGAMFSEGRTGIQRQKCFLFFTEENNTRSGRRLSVEN